MAHTITWPKRLNSQTKKLENKTKTRRSSPPRKGPIGNVIAVAGAIAAVIRAALGSQSDRENQGLRKGAAGEEAVAKELDKLPDGWFVVNDVRVGESQIDHIVLGPKGIFCIETKHSGTVRIDKGGNFYRLEKKMWVPTNSPAVQNMRHIKSLKKFLSREFDFHPTIKSVVVYVGQGRFELEALTVPPGNTRIAFFNNLRDYLLAQPDVSWNTNRLREMAFAIAGVTEAGRA